MNLSHRFIQNIYRNFQQVTSKPLDKLIYQKLCLISVKQTQMDAKIDELTAKVSSLLVSRPASSVISLTKLNTVEEYNDFVEKLKDAEFRSNIVWMFLVQLFFSNLSNL